jgi:hypothetical protein
MDRPAAGDDLLIASALASVKRAAETSRTSLGQLDVTAPVDEVVSRMQAAASQLQVLKQAISESSLRYQAVRPVAVPGNPAHVPEFLRTRKDAHVTDSDAVAERRGAAASTTTSEHNAVVEALAQDYDRRAMALVSELRARHADALAAIVR